MDAQTLIGRVAPVEIIDVRSNSLYGRLAARPSEGELNMALADATPADGDAEA